MRVWEAVSDRVTAVEGWIPLFESAGLMMVLMRWKKCLQAFLMAQSTKSLCLDEKRRAFEGGEAGEERA